MNHNFASDAKAARLLNYDVVLNSDDPKMLAKALNVLKPDGHLVSI
ncbi:hypothetical protein GFB56_33180 [Ensifer sp. T173]|uniref:Uncharacterized protein n=1 Tax=Ensifer canadensis TaxID=555315 RepID=A0AAW4FVY4_9HYPH|nr:hypothetical protein [Ensifer canadensis]